MTEGLRIDRWLAEPAPPERLAMFRIMAGAVVVGYLAARHRAFLDLAEQPGARFEPVGVLGLQSSPFPDWLIPVLLVAGLVAGVAFCLGAGFRVVGPVLAAVLLMLTSYRSSWGQLLHFENLMLIHVMILAFAPAAAAWSVDARRKSSLLPDTRFGWPLKLAAIATVLTYFIAGLAKLRYGGVDWVVGDTLRNHVAYSASRLDLLGGDPAPLAERLVPHAWLFPPLAAATVIVELAAPFALVSRGIRNVWVALAWSMHVAILAMMSVAFHWPLLGIAYAPLFDLERLVPRSKPTAAPPSGRLRAQVPPPC